jgi:hypothetical protein
MKKELKEGMGFICETLEDKKRIWQKLTDAGYPMYCKWEDALHENYGIRYDKQGLFGSVANHLIPHPLNESDFFNDWTPKAGEWVEVSTKEDPDNYSKRQYLCTIDSVHLCVEGGASYTQTGYFFEWKHIRKIKPETMTLQEVREALGKPNLIVTQ